MSMFFMGLSEITVPFLGFGHPNSVYDVSVLVYPDVSDDIPVSSGKNVDI